MAYGARALWPRSVRSSGGGRVRRGRAGKPSTGRRDTGAYDRQGTVRYARCETPQPYWRSSVTLPRERPRWTSYTATTVSTGEPDATESGHVRFGGGPAEKGLLWQGPRWRPTRRPVRFGGRAPPKECMDGRGRPPQPRAPLGGRPRS